MTAATREHRRRQIMDATVRITTRGGLQAATFRTVADEAGVSVRLVQYYFGTKDQLLTDTLAFVGAEVAARIASRLTALGPDPAPRMMLDAIFDEFLPVDATRRAAMLVFIAFRTVALTDERLASSNRLGLGPALLAEIEAVIDRATTGRDNPTIDPASEAVVLVGTMTAVANGVLAGDITAPDARRHLRYALDRTFGTIPTDH